MKMGHVNPARLPPGTRVGPWRVVDRRGWGAFGTVYLAEGVEPASAGLVALKLAQRPGDERFEREVELLSRVRHSNVPRLLDHGQWQSPEGVAHPYVSMELVDGIPLYDWARASAPTSRQVLGLLAGLARALAAIHAAAGVHRDLKGDNVLVRREDGRPFLVDFGSASYRGSAPLTSQVFPPGTSLYRSPEAYRHAIRFGRESATPYAPGPADDVFALGVTAYRLVTEEYPPSPDPLNAEAERWHVEGVGPQPARELNARCCPELSALISRMLAVRPEVRGSARELAEALAGAAWDAGPGADVPLFRREVTNSPEIEEAAPQRRSSSAPRLERRKWLAVAGVGTALAWIAAGAFETWSARESAWERVAGQGKERDAGTVALGESAVTASVSPIYAPYARLGITLALPSKPFPGQTRPDANGRCPRKLQVSINGGCWVKLVIKELKDCEEDGYVYKGECYGPAFPPVLPSTANPSQCPVGR